MTKSLVQINSGVDYTTGNLLPSATINNLRDNAEVAFSTSAATIGKSVWYTHGSAPVPQGNAFWALYTYLGVTYQVAGQRCGSAQLSEATDAPSGECAVGYNSYTSKWLAKEKAPSTTLYYATGTNNLQAFASSTHANSFGAYAMVYVGGTSNVVAMCGYTGSVGCVATFSASTLSVYSAAGGADALTGIATNGIGKVVAVGGTLCSYSADYGATWTHDAFATEPPDLVRNICWDATNSVFVCSGMTSAGYLFWSTSPTGATWQPWKRTANPVISSDVLAVVSEIGSGIAVVGGAWVSPYVDGVYSMPSVGVLVSYDNGASWRPIPGASAFDDANGLRAVPMGNNVLIYSNSSVAVAGPFVANDIENAVVIT